MDALEAILSRVSAIRLVEPGPSPAQIDTILRAAASAPDHGRLKPWRFAVLTGAQRDLLGRGFIAAKRRAAPDTPEDKLEAEAAKAHRAPTIIAVAARSAPGGKVPEFEQWIAVGAAVQNMFLAAHALGLGAMWKTGALAYDPDLIEALGFGREDRLIAYLYLGTPEALPPVPARDYADALCAPRA